MQEAILRLTTFWTEHGCVLSQPFNTEVGAGTLNPATFLRVLGPEPWSTVYVEPSVRPDDSRYGDNPNRMQTHTQLQVILKPDPGNSMDLYLESLAAIGIDTRVHDVRFVEDNWESPALGAWGLGWEVWLDGLEITQYTYFQQAGGVQVDPVAVEITYGLERILMALQGVSHFKEIRFSDSVAYGEIVGQAEREMSVYYLDDADVDVVRGLFDTYEQEARRLIAGGLPIPAQYYVLKCSHAFNILDSRGAVGTVERARAFKTMRGLAHEIAELYIASRAELDHPLGVAEPRQAPSPAEPSVPAPTEPATFLLELGFEELPPDQVDSYASQLEAGLADLFERNRVAHGSISVVGSPRRIVAEVSAVAPAQAEHVATVRGPKRTAAFDADGAPTRAAAGFAGKHGVDPADLETVTVDGVEYVAVTRPEPVRPTAEVLADELPGVIGSISPRRAMRWSAGPAFGASRALRWIVALLGDHVVGFTYADVASGSTTRVLRNSDQPLVEVLRADGFVGEVLAANGVVADGAERRRRILRDATELAESVGGSIDVDADGAVLDEVTNLVENPQVILGSFDEAYLRLPPEVLTVVMKKHQRYLPVRDASGELLAHFVSVANGPIDEDAVREGNEAVLRARYADAAFFFDRDREQTLETFRPLLDKLVFEARAGSMLQRADRVEALAVRLGELLEVSDEDAATIARAAHLAKADLSTSLVVELSSLAGQLGRVYALADGESPAVADAIFEASLPRFAGDQLPESLPGAVVATADRADQLLSLFAVGAMPTGSNDPYGLRRSATGLTQILDRHGLALRLSELFALAAEQIPDEVEPKVFDDLASFIGVRIEVRLSEEGHDVELVRSLAPRFDVPAEVAPALAELEELQRRPDFVEVVDAYRRVSRLAGDAEAAEVDPGLLEDGAEREMWEAFSAREEQMASASSIVDYFDSLATITPAISRFFDDVLVMAEDQAVRANRLALLTRIRNTGSALVDWEKIPDPTT